MARKIPSDFDYKNENLDSNETYIRDILKVKIENWAKFRYSIYAGNNSDVLVSSDTIENNVKQAFIELAKSHYEVVNSIGYAKFCYFEILDLDKQKSNFLFRTTKAIKEFYFHLGAVFDNLARLIYILNSPESATQKNGSRLLRHWIDWPQLSKKFNFENYCSFTNHPTLIEILNLRNNFTHNWRPILLVDPTNGELYLSLKIRKSRNYLWAYEESTEFNKEYVKEKRPLVEFLKDDFSFAEEAQNIIFNKLLADLEVFEKNYNINIKNDNR